jgi:hypothetical protein
MTNQLLAHCDTRRVDENAVLAVPSPDFTKSWRPVSHGQVIQTLEAACQYHGIAVRSREYSMSANGAKMFGVWELDITVDGTAFSLGVRNSIDKSFGIGITAGTKVFVCDNLCFSGDYIRFRKHTAGLDMDELTEIANEAVTGAVVKMERLYNWQDSLHNVFVPELRAQGAGLRYGCRRRFFRRQDPGLFERARRRARHQPWPRFGWRP